MCRLIMAQSERFMMPVERNGNRIRVCCGALVALLAAVHTSRAEDPSGQSAQSVREPPAVRLAPIERSAAGSSGRVDPMRPARLSNADRDKLYEQVSRDAEALERQGASSGG